MEMKSCCRLQIPRRRSFVRMVTKLDILLVTMIVFQGLSQDVGALSIREMGNKHVIENGSSTVVLMDCNYEYEQKDMEGFVLKWFHNSKSTPIYQWIPPADPQTQWNFTEHLDLKHLVTNDTYTKHRALRIVNATMEMAGTYKCEVSSILGEVKGYQDLIIYVPADKVEINYTKPTETSVNVTCHVDGLYPQPDATMFWYKEEFGLPKIVEEAEQRAQKINEGVDGNGGLFAADVYSVFEDSSLFRENHFECVFTIPNTGYVIKGKLTYRPVED